MCVWGGGKGPQRIRRRDTQGFTNAMTHSLRIPATTTNAIAMSFTNFFFAPRRRPQQLRRLARAARAPHSPTTFRGASPSAPFAGRAWRNALGEHGLHGRRFGHHAKPFQDLDRDEIAVGLRDFSGKSPHLQVFPNGLNLSATSKRLLVGDQEEPFFGELGKAWAPPCSHAVALTRSREERHDAI